MAYSSHSLHMFPEQPFPLPIIEVSLDSSLDPDREIALGKALESLRDEGVLILSGGLSIHNMRDLKQFSPDTASEQVKDFERTVIKAATSSQKHRLDELKKVVRHPGFRLAHPREEHFVPIYIAAGAGSQGDAKVLCDLHGAVTIAFGL
jgi:aromatic ring-opening dioxygenase catalytic subunit (LigB family)